MTNIIRRIASCLQINCNIKKVQTKGVSWKAGNMVIAKFDDGFNYKAIIIGTNNTTYTLCYHETIEQKPINQDSTTIMKYTLNQQITAHAYCDRGKRFEAELNCEKNWGIIENKSNCVKIFFGSTKNLFDIVGHKVAYVHNRNMLLETNMSIGWSIVMINGYTLKHHDNIGSILRRYYETNGFIIFMIVQTTLRTLDTLRSLSQKMKTQRWGYYFFMNHGCSEILARKRMLHSTLQEHTRQLAECKLDMMLYTYIPKFKNIHQYAIGQKVGTRTQYSPWIIGYVFRQGVKPHILIGTKENDVLYTCCKKLGQKRIAKIFSISYFDILWSQFGGKLRSLRNYEIRISFELHTDICFDMAGYNCRDDDASEIVNCIERNTHVQELLLTPSIFNTDSIGLIITSLSKNDTINYVDISDIVISKGVLKSIVSLLNAKKYLTVVIQGSVGEECTDIEHTSSHGYIDDEIIIIMSIFRRNTSLCSIELYNNRITCRGAAVIASYIKTSSTLHTLILDGNMIGDVGLVALGNAIKYNTRFRGLNIGVNKFTHVGVCSYLEHTRTHPSLLAIVCGYNTLGDHCAETICKTIMMNSVIVLIDLVCCKLGHVAARLLANGLQSNTTVDQLKLDLNEITHKGVKHLAHALMINKTLAALHLRCCAIDSRGVIYLAKMLEVNSTLYTLHISNNSIGDDGLSVLCAGIAKNHTLQELSIAGNNITCIGAITIAGILKNNPCIEKLNLQFNSIGDLGIQTLCTSLKKNSVLLILDVRKNNFNAPTIVFIKNVLNNNNVIKDILYDTVIDNYSR